MGNDAILVAHRRYSQHDPDLCLLLDGFVGINLELLLHGRLFKTADIVHIHGGIRRSQVAFGTLKNKSKAKWILHYHGSETRMGYGLYHEDLADAKVVSTPDLKRWHSDATWIPNPIPQVFEPPVQAKTIGGERIKVGHFPTNRALKGTKKVIRALDPLVQEGLAKLLIIEGRPHREIMETMRTVDVVVDQLNDLSIFSKVALEAMAIGIPAISSYDDGIFPSDCPVLRANTEEELRERVLNVIDEGIDDKLRSSCAGYVKRYHSPHEVAARLDEIYRQK
jgi:glycosyltransferase involved in cell wall biosynthesis